MRPGVGRNTFCTVGDFAWHLGLSLKEIWFIDCWYINLHNHLYMYTPTQNAATQNAPDDLTSLDLYWRAPPNPDSPEEYQELPQWIQFWWILLILLNDLAIPMQSSYVGLWTNLMQRTIYMDSMQNIAANSVWNSSYVSLFTYHRMFRC